MSYLCSLVEFNDFSWQNVAHTGVEPDQVARSEVPWVVHDDLEADLQRVKSCQEGSLEKEIKQFDKI